MIDGLMAIRLPETAMVDSHTQQRRWTREPYGARLRNEEPSQGAKLPEESGIDMAERIANMADDHGLGLQHTPTADNRKDVAHVRRYRSLRRSVLSLVQLLDDTMLTAGQQIRVVYTAYRMALARMASHDGQVEDEIAQVRRYLLKATRREGQELKGSFKEIRTRPGLEASRVCRNHRAMSVDRGASLCAHQPPMESASPRPSGVSRSQAPVARPGTGRRSRSIARLSPWGDHPHLAAILAGEPTPGWGGCP